jgi:hypothetical protein
MLKHFSTKKVKASKSTTLQGALARKLKGLRDDPGSSNRAAVNPVGAERARNRLRSSRRPAGAFLSEETRCLNCCRCAPDRRRAGLPQRLASHHRICNEAAPNLVGVDLGRDRLRSSRKPAGAFLSEETRCLNCCRCAPDRRRAGLTQRLASHHGISSGVPSRRGRVGAAAPRSAAVIQLAKPGAGPSSSRNLASAAYALSR